MGKKKKKENNIPGEVVGISVSCDYHYGYTHTQKKSQ